MLLLVEGLPESQTRHVNEMRTLIQGRGLIEIIGGTAHTALWNAVAEFPSPAVHHGRVVCRAGGAIGCWIDLVHVLDGSREAVGPVEVLAHAGSGLLYAASSAGAERRWPRLWARRGPDRRLHRGRGGPPPVKGTLPVWGPPSGAGALELMRRLRKAYDPRGIMVPGRLGWVLS